MISLDIRIDRFPRRPVFLVHPPAVVIEMRSLFGTRDHVQDVAVNFPLPVVSADLQLGHAIEIAKILEILPLNSRGVDFVLEQTVLEIDEERRLIVAQLRLDPVLGIEKDFAVCFPNAIVLHPCPFLRILRREIDLRFEIQQTALHEELNRVGGQHDARSQHAGLHLDVDEKVRVEIVWTTQTLAHLVECCPGARADNTVSRQVVCLLESNDGRARFWTKDTVGFELRICSGGVETDLKFFDGPTPRALLKLRLRGFEKGNDDANGVQQVSDERSSLLPAQFVANGFSGGQPIGSIVKLATDSLFDRARNIGGWVLEWPTAMLPRRKRRGRTTIRSSV